MNEMAIIKSLATELAKRDYDSLCCLVSTMSFEGAFKALGGFNLDEVEGFFDCNYKSIALTIYRDSRFGGCIVSDTMDVWHDDISSPIDTITIKR